MELAKFNCFFVNFLSYSFERIKVILAVFEREYTTDLLCISVGWFLYDKTGFTERYSLTDFIF